MNSYSWLHQCWLTCKKYHQLCEDTGCSLENLPGAMDNKKGYERERESVCQGAPWLLAWFDDDLLNSSSYNQKSLTFKVVAILLPHLKSAFSQFFDYKLKPLLVLQGKELQYYWVVLHKAMFFFCYNNFYLSKSIQRVIPLILKWLKFIPQQILLKEQNTFRWVRLVRFYGISALVGYLMPNSSYTYIYQTCTICKWIVFR